jgi:hypothetical protein
MQSKFRIHEQRGEMSSRPRSFALVHLQMFLMAILFSCIPSSQAFEMRMTYKSPVKSSVGKLVDRRFSRDSAGPGDSPRPSSSKSAYAAGISYAPAPGAVDDSFEQRMRNMVLGNPKRTVATVVPKRKLPPNVHVVQTLQEYKKMVADETQSIVAVRFYAPWCKVRLHIFFRSSFSLEQELCQKLSVRSHRFSFLNLPFRHVELSHLSIITWRRSIQM